MKHLSLEDGQVLPSFKPLLGGRSLCLGLGWLPVAK